MKIMKTFYLFLLSDAGLFMLLSAFLFIIHPYRDEKISENKHKGKPSLAFSYILYMVEGGKRSFCFELTLVCFHSVRTSAFIAVKKVYIFNMFYINNAN